MFWTRFVSSMAWTRSSYVAVVPSALTAARCLDITPGRGARDERAHRGLRRALANEWESAALRAKSARACVTE